MANPFAAAGLATAGAAGTVGLALQKSGIGQALSGLGSMVSQASRQMSDSSARTAQVASGLASQVQQIAAQNSAASAGQAEILRKWQEQQNAKTMAFNAAEAQKNRDWQKMMSDTAHQREIADLKAAGLNPVLSAMGGQGASVGSGATASGVTSAGAKGDVDESASSGLVSLLGTLMNTQTQLLSTAMSARSNEAVADKYTAMEELVAHLTGQYGLSREQLSGEYGLQKAHVSGSYGLQSSQISAAASKYASDQARAAQKYSADRSYMSSVYNAGKHLEGVQYQTDVGLKETLERILADERISGDRNATSIITSIIGALGGIASASVR